MTDIVEKAPKDDVKAEYAGDKLQFVVTVGPQQLMMPGEEEPVGTRKVVTTDTINKDNVERFTAGIQAQIDSMKNKIATMGQQIAQLEAQGIHELGPRLEQVIAASKEIAANAGKKENAHAKFERKFFKETGGMFNHWKTYAQLKFQMAQTESNLEKAEAHLQLIKSAKKSL